MADAASVRPATPDDAVALAEAHVRAWQEAYRGLLSSAYLDGLEPQDRLPMILHAFGPGADERAVILVAEDAEGIAGFVRAGPGDDGDAEPATAQVWAIYVRARAWDRGVGRLLMEAALGRLATLGFASATLWVLATNARAIRFYERTGWRPDGTEQDDVIGGDTVRELRYRRSLT